MRDGKCYGQRVCAPRSPSEQLESELRPWVHPHHDTVVEYRHACRFEDGPAHLGVHMRTLVIPLPGTQHVALAEQLYTRTPEHIDVAREQSINYQKSTMMFVGFDRARGVPIPWRQAADTGERLASRALTFRVVEQVAE